MNFNDLLEKHKEFTKDYYETNTLSDKQKEELLKTLCLALHHEVSQIVTATNFKVFDKSIYETNKNEIVYNSVDSFRYVLAILGLYNISADEFVSAYKEKDLYLEKRKHLKQHIKGQPVAIIDIDDVICDFRSYFNNWLYKTYNIKIDENSTSYYSSKEVKDFGLSPEGVFETFIQKDQLLQIPSIFEAIQTINYLKDNNYYIQLLTSRPENNLKCKYQTYMWLDNNGVCFDNLSFAPEKYIWVSKQSYYTSGDVKFAIDDSPKHSMEYATHDVNVLMPDLPYNKQARHDKINIFQKSKMLEEIKNLINKV
tara:strand:- start:1220 stop:2152 length:933 start_codon:yes stop_codon:yes gene_type:complete